VDTRATRPAKSLKGYCVPFPHELFLLMAPAGASKSTGLTIFLIQMGAFVAIIYFLMIRPKVQQEKKHRQRLSEIKRGDQIVTLGGIVGEVVHIKDDLLTVKTGETRIVIVRDRVAQVGAPNAPETTTTSS